LVEAQSRCANAARTLRERCATVFQIALQFALQSLCNRFAIVLQSLCKHFAIALQSLCDRFAIFSKPQRYLLAIALQLL
jgi:hypothetical protein